MKSFLYLIYSEIGFMIGKSSDIYRRFAVIDNHSPIDLQLFRVYKIEKNGYHEKRLHKMFTAKQIRGGWYALDLEDIKEIDIYLKKHKGTRILDNYKKILKSPDPSKISPDSDQAGFNLNKDLDKLEDAIARLNDALFGRKRL